jgi:hypothetical protein
MRIYSGCKGFSRVGIVMLALSMPALSSADQRTSSSNLNAPFFQDLSQVQWEKMLPELGETSPEIDTAHPANDKRDSATNPLAKGAPRAEALAFGQRDAHDDHRQSDVRV